MNSPTQPHDHFFKLLFSDTQLVLSYLKGSLPQEWFASLDANTLRRVEDSFVDQELREQLTDVVYQCQLQGSSNQVNLVFLLEHKSYVPAYPHLQLLRYMLNLWQKQIQQGQPLQPIVPMVVYHGRTDWEVKPFEEYFFIQGDQWLGQFRPDFAYHLTNLRQESPEQIEQQYEALVLKKAFLLMKWIFDKQLGEHVKTIFEDLFTSPADQPESKYFRIFITYLTHSPNPEKNQIMADLKSLAEEWELPKDSFAYQWVQEIKQQGREEGIEQGMEKGIEKGMAKGIGQGFEQGTRNSIVKMLKKGFLPEQVADILEVSLSLVQEIAREISEK